MSKEDLRAEVIGTNEALAEKIIEALKTCYDPEIPVDIYELGLIYRINIEDPEAVHIDMTLTSPNCPAAESLPSDVKKKAEGVEGVGEVEVEVVWDPTWTPEKMSEVAKLELGMW